MFSMSTLKLGITGPAVWHGRLPDGRKITVEKLDEDMNEGYFYVVKFQGVEVLKGWFAGFNLPERSEALNDSTINALLLTPEQVKESIDRTESVGDAPANILSALEDALAGETTEQVVAGLKAMRANASSLIETLDKMLTSFDKNSAN